MRYDDESTESVSADRTMPGYRELALSMHGPSTGAWARAADAADGLSDRRSATWAGRAGPGP